MGFKIPRLSRRASSSLASGTISKLYCGSLAQSVEQRTFNPLVEGSNPSRPTTLNQHLNGCFFYAQNLG